MNNAIKRPTKQHTF